MKLDDEILPGIEMENIPCPLGCPSDDEWVLDSYDYHNSLPGKFSVIRCRICGLMRTNPRPTAETIGKYYPDTYLPYSMTKVDLDKHRSGWKKLVQKLLPFYNNHLPALVPGYMLEVGCASGSFLHKMAHQSWQVEGIETSSAAGQAAQKLGYRVQITSLEKAQAPHQPLDLVVGWMTVEHLHDPIRALKKLAEWSKPGGYLVISVPNCASIDFQWFGRWNYAVHLPAHLYHFTPKTMRHVLNESGWQVERIFHQRSATNLMGSLGYYLRDHGSSNRFVEWLVSYSSNGPIHYVFYPLGWFLGMIGQSGRMTIWARKAGEESINEL